jgi:CheY-like chemotaxis protein
MSRVLIVDDDQITRRVLGGALQQDGHEVAYASDGEAALDWLRRSPFDVVLTDLAMPGLNGLRLIRAIRDGGDQIPVVAISGQNADQLLLAEDYGATATLFKPVKRSDLLRTVKGVARETDEFWENVWL